MIRRAFSHALLIPLALAPPVFGAAISSTNLPPIPATELSNSFGISTPEVEGMDSAKLADLADWIREKKLPIFSLLISRHGKLVYELYTSNLDRDEAHYLMSVTKSFTSALIGEAIDQHLIAGVDTPLNKVLPRSVFADDSQFRRFSNLSVKDILGMSALDALEPPHGTTPDAVDRANQFAASRDHLALALTQKLLPSPGVTFQYNDITPLLAVGMIEYTTGQSALQYAEKTFFKPLGFKNEEWTDQDPSGLDNGAYGLRLRPIDMQKFGNLYLDGGKWNGHQLISKAWVDQSFQPWIRDLPTVRMNDYGWYWWQGKYGNGWVSHEARGWKGQRIVVIPDQQMVVTWTSDIEDDSENAVFDQMMRQFIVPASNHAANVPPDPKAAAHLTDVLTKIHAVNLIPPQAEKRMIPSVRLKEYHRDFASPIPPVLPTDKSKPTN